MAQNARVPQFGKWDNDGSVPYTQYFENARKGKNATKLINPNDPLENPEAFLVEEYPAPVHAHPSRIPSNEGSSRVKHARRKSREDSEGHQALNYMSTDSVPTHKRASGSPYHDQGNLVYPQRKSGNGSGEVLHSIDRSPHHPSLVNKSIGKGGVSSPSRERRPASEKHGLAPNTPGRTKMKPTDRTDNSHDKGSAVPKFGEWDVMDPASADSYSYIFNQVREEKHNGSNNIPSFSRDTNSTDQKKINTGSTDVCCFCFKK